MRRGLVNKKLKLFDQAISDYDQAIKIDPKNDEAFRYKGKLFHDLEETTGNKEYLLKAIYNYTKAIEINNYNSSAFTSRGDARALLHKSDPEKYSDLLFKFLKDYSDAVILKPTDDKTLFKLGYFLWPIDEKMACGYWKDACNLGNKSACEYLKVSCK